MIIAIDGPAGAGKSTVAKLVAQRLDFLYLNTGAMYRAITLKALKEGIDLNNGDILAELARKTKIDFEVGSGQVILDGDDVSQDIKKPEIDRNISTVVKHPQLREVMVRQQQSIGINNNIVVEGRDITTVVFPKAEIKIYLDASIEERAKRRHAELREKGYNIDLAQVIKETSKRDEADKTREHGALKVAHDAILLDTTGMSIEQVVESILEVVEKPKS